MAAHIRIPQTFIDDLLARTDIVGIIEPFITLKKTGANYVACCPFHQEKTPSFTVSPSKQIYHCFGCGVGGNAISFLMEYEHLDFMDAVKTLASQSGMNLPQQSATKQPSGDTNIFYILLEKATKFYQNQLLKHPQAKIARDFLKKRGLTEKTITQFKIGYAPPGWDNLLRKLNNNDKYKKLLLSAGMLIQKTSTSIYDRFRNRIMFPITNRSGKIIAFGGRVINDNDTPKYLNSPETPIFHKGHELYGLYEARQANRNLKRLLLVEGYMDVIILAQHGINYAVATLGTAITTNHIQKLFRACPEVIFCFDGDNAGRIAAWRTLEIILPLLHDNWQAKFIFLPEGEDPDSWVQKIGKKSFEELIQNADTLSTFFFTHLSKQINLQQIDDRARFAQLAMSYIQNMPDNIRKEMLIDALAQKINMTPEKLNNYITTNQPGEITTTNTQAMHSPIRTVITLLIQNPQLIDQIDQELPTLDIAGMPLLHELHSLLKNNSQLTTGAILEHWRDSAEYQHLNRLANYKHLLEGSSLTVEFCGAIKKLHLQATESTINQLITKANTTGLTDIEKKQLQNLLKTQQNR
jgi:DNA primase